MKANQIKKLGVSIMLFFSLVIGATLLFRIPIIANLFSAQRLTGVTGILLWVCVWVFIMLECAIIPGPYLPFVVIFAQTSMADNKWLFLLYVTSAVAVGRVGAWFFGKYSGGKLLKWAAGDEESFKNWCKKLDGPAGKWTYAVTVAAPGFPDFILAWVAGAININFTFYMIVNVVCKGIENALIIWLSFLLNANASFWLYIYIGIIITGLIMFIVGSVLENKKNKC